MPCRDYMDDYQEGLQKKCDMLSRIACKALTHIEETADGLEILILKDPEIAKWWHDHKEADRLEQARLKREREENRLRASALAKLTPAEKKILGVR